MHVLGIHICTHMCQSNMNYMKTDYDIKLHEVQPNVIECKPDGLTQSVLIILTCPFVALAELYCTFGECNRVLTPTSNLRNVFVRKSFEWSEKDGAEEENRAERSHIYISIENPNPKSKYRHCSVLGLGILTMVLPTYLPTTTTNNNNT